jgi:hypothetical protein
MTPRTLQNDTGSRKPWTKLNLDNIVWFLKVTLFSKWFGPVVLSILKSRNVSLSERSWSRLLLYYSILRISIAILRHLIRQKLTPIDWSQQVVVVTGGKVYIIYSY